MRLRFLFRILGGLTTGLSPSAARRKMAVASLAALFFGVANVEAHPVAQGSMEVRVMGSEVRLTMRVSMEEVLVQNALSAGVNEARVTPSELCRRHGDYLLQHVRLLADGAPIAGRVAVVTPPVVPGPQRAIYELTYSSPGKTAQLRVEENVLNEFSYAPGNRWEATYVVRIAQENQPVIEGLLLTSGQPILIDQGAPLSSADKAQETTLNKWRLFCDYLRHGILHILTGYDHLLFISALVLAVVTLWDLVKVVSAFTLAHSITLTLSVLDVVRLPERVVEPMIAASIVFVALQNVFWPQRSRGAARLGVAFFFGLFHGLGFAGGLLSAMEGMTGLAIGLAIVAFSLGVEIGHQVVVLPVFGVLRVLRARDGGTRLANGLFRYGSAAIVVAGMVYLVAALRIR
jgi:hypothetical protein